MDIKDKDPNNLCAPGKDGKPLCVDDHVVDGYKKVIKQAGVLVSNNYNDIKKKIIEVTNCKKGDETCVLNSEKVREVVGHAMVREQLKNNFKPKGPRNNNDWLDNFQIDGFIKQLGNYFNGERNPKTNKKKANVYHIEFQMRDFQETNGELAKIDICNDIIGKGYTHMVCVLNTDYSSGSGIHWFCIVLDFQGKNSVNNIDKNRKDLQLGGQYPYTIEYFNSSGQKPLPEVSRWMTQKQEEIEHNCNYPCIEILVNLFAHQMGNSECGVYCLHYIWSRLEGHPYSDWRERRYTDSEMLEWRKRIFR